MAKETTTGKGSKAPAPAKPAHPAIEVLAKRLAEVREVLDSREQAVLDATAERDASQEHYDALHAAAFGSEYGVITGGTGSNSEDSDGKPIPPNWEILMGEIPEPTEEE